MTRWLYVIGIAGIGAGTAMVYAAVIAKGVFIPGTILILIGMLAIAAGGIHSLVRPAAHE